MPIAYFILVVISFVFSRLHFPLANIILLLGLLVLLVDLITQIIRLAMKKIPLSTLLASIALLFIGIGYTFTWLFWPGSKVSSVFGLLIAAGFVGYWLKINAKPTARFVITMFMMMTLGIFTTMKSSSVYCLKHNLDSGNVLAPVHQQHLLAWLYNQEKNYGSSLQLMLTEKKFLEESLSKITDTRPGNYYIESLRYNLEIVNAAVSDLSRKNWNNYESLVPVN